MTFTKSSLVKLNDVCVKGMNDPTPLALGANVIYKPPIHIFDNSFITANFRETDEDEESPYNSDMDEEGEISTNLSTTNQSAGGFKSTAKMRGMLSRVLETRSSVDRSQVMANLKQKLGSQISLKRMSRENLAGL